MIYADNAATTMLDPLAFELMLPFLKDSYSNPSSLHSFGKVASKAIESARQQIAECIGASPVEILFTSGGTESNNWAIKGLVDANKASKKNLVTSNIEHHTVLNSCYAMKRNGCHTTLLTVDNKGLVSPDDLKSAITSDTLGISIIFANNEIGTIQDIPSLVSIAKVYGVPFHTDAVQTVGHMPLNVSKLGVDLLSASAHKFNGPKGVGFLYKRRGIHLLPFLDGGYQEDGNRAGTENVAGIVGMACALKEHHANLSENMHKLRCITELFVTRVSEAIPDAKFNGHPTQHLPGLISLSLPRISGESLLHLLDLKGISVSTGAACNSKDSVISHVLKAIHLPPKYSRGTLRLSLSKDNTKAEAIIIADTIIKIHSKLCS